MHTTRGYLVLLVTTLSFIACSGARTEPAATEATGEPRRQLSSEECEAGGGSVVGDIGDGAIHRPDYRCPGGSAPTGTIRAPEGGPTAIEGAVCCPQPPAP